LNENNVLMWYYNREARQDPRTSSFRCNF